VWSVLRPRRYDPAVARAVLVSASDDLIPVRPPTRTVAAPMTRAYG
jgi:hypothetical protein